MRHRPLVTLAAGAILLLAACSSGGATSAPTTAASAAPSAEAPAAPPAAACAESAAAGEVSVAIKDFAFGPADIQAKVGQTVTFTNNDSAPHTATLDDGSCTTPNISNGASDGLVLSAAGTYPFHCSVHPTMKGTITVS
ncbi:MAG: cupredoxin domain-containing protein [Candidatus Limnocylindrales bacterium]|nr:cupredoxin domain-containing protein [Candidatus Limnocylindrales bacterium]